MYKIKNKYKKNKKMKTIDDVFVFAKLHLQEQIDCNAYQSFLQEITNALRDLISEHHSVQEIYKLSILVNLLIKRAERYGITHRLSTLIEVLETSTMVRMKEKYENVFLPELLIEIQSMEEKELEKHFEINF